MLILMALWGCAAEPDPTTPPSSPSSPLPAEAPAAVDPAAAAARAAEVRSRAQAALSPLPDTPVAGPIPLSNEVVELGRTIFHEVRLSPGQDRSCSSCHGLDLWGVDGLPVPRLSGQTVGTRNTPSVYNASLQSSLYWDGRVGTIEQQSAEALLDPLKLGAASTARVEEVLRSIPGYAPLFQAAFPEAEAPVNAENAALALASFQRSLLNPAPIDHFLAGRPEAISAEQVEGLSLFLELQCASCHGGPVLGGGALTDADADAGVSKVPSLRNVDRTGPWRHDGSVSSLVDMLSPNARHHVDRELEPAQLASLLAFLGSLTGDLPEHLVMAPTLPPAGPNTPAPE